MQGLDGRAARRPRPARNRAGAEDDRKHVAGEGGHAPFVGDQSAILGVVGDEGAHGARGGELVALESGAQQTDKWFHRPRGGDGCLVGLVPTRKICKRHRRLLPSTDDRARATSLRDDAHEGVDAPSIRNRGAVNLCVVGNAAEDADGMLL